MGRRPLADGIGQRRLRLPGHQLGPLPVESGRLLFQRLQLRQGLACGCAGNLLQPPGDAVESAGRMSVFNGSGDADHSVDWTPPRHRHGTARSRMDEERFRGEHRPDWRGLVGAIYKDRRRIAAPPGLQLGPAVDLPDRLRQQRQAVFGIQEEPCPRVAVSVRVRVAREQVGDQVGGAPFPAVAPCSAISHSTRVLSAP